LNLIEIAWDDSEPPDWIEPIESYCQRILLHIGVDNWEVSLRFTSDHEIQELNRVYREKDEPTDILTFSQIEEENSPSLIVFDASQADTPHPVGDLVISLNTVRQNADYFSVPLHEELSRVLIHGILHLKGLDHSTNEPHEPMLLFQEKILSMVKPLEGL